MRLQNNEINSSEIVPSKSFSFFVLFKKKTQALLRFGEGKLFVFVETIVEFRITTCLKDNSSSIAPLVKKWSKGPFPKVLSAEWSFTDFRRFGMENPTYFTIYRDPLERSKSHYYFNVQRHYSLSHKKPSKLCLDLF